MLFDYAAENKVSKEEILKFIDETLANMEKSWSEIVRSYEKLKIYSVSAPKYIRNSKT